MKYLLWSLFAAEFFIFFMLVIRGRNNGIDKLVDYFFAFVTCLNLIYLAMFIAADGSAEQHTTGTSSYVLLRTFLYPVVYLITRKVLCLREKILAKDIVHFLPFVTVLILFIESEQFSLLLLAESSWLSLVPSLGASPLANLLVLTCVATISTCYLWPTLRDTWPYAFSASNNSEAMALRWIFFFSASNGLFATSTLIYHIAICIRYPELTTHNYDGGVYALLSSLIAFAVSLAYFNISQTRRDKADKVNGSDNTENNNLVITSTVHEIEEVLSVTTLEFQAEPEQHTIDSDETEKYRHSALTKSESEYYFEKVESVIKEKKLYLEHSLKIADLSNELGLGGSYISQVINQNHGHSFNEYINHFRVAVAREKIESVAGEGGRVLPRDISFEAGFGSASTFYKAFKQTTGMTPKKYLCICLQSEEKKLQNSTDSLNSIDPVDFRP